MFQQGLNSGGEEGEGGRAMQSLMSHLLLLYSAISQHPQPTFGPWCPPKAL